MTHPPTLDDLRLLNSGPTALRGYPLATPPKAAEPNGSSSGGDAAPAPDQQGARAPDFVSDSEFDMWGPSIAHSDAFFSAMLGARYRRPTALWVVNTVEQTGRALGMHPALLISDYPTALRAKLLQHVKACYQRLHNLTAAGAGAGGGGGGGRGGGRRA